MRAFVFVDQGVMGGQRYVDVLNSDGEVLSVDLPFEEAIAEYGDLPARALVPTCPGGRHHDRLPRRCAAGPNRRRWAGLAQQCRVHRRVPGLHTGRVPVPVHVSHQQAGDCINTEKPTLCPGAEVVTTAGRAPFGSESPCRQHIRKIVAPSGDEKYNNNGD